MKVVVVAAALALVLGAFACTTVLQIDDGEGPPLAEGGVPDAAAGDAMALTDAELDACALTIDATEIDFGQVLLRSKRSMTFTLGNTGDRPLTVALSPGLALPFTVRLDAQVIPAGGAVEGTVSLPPAATESIITLEVALVLLTSPTCKREIAVRATVVDQDYVFSGVDFHDVPCGTTPPNRAILLSASSTAAPNTSWTATGLSPPFAFAGVVSGSITAGMTLPIDVSFTAPKERPLPLVQPVAFMLSPSPTTPPAGVSVKANPVGAFVSFDPATVSFGGTMSATVDVENLGNRAAPIAFRTSVGWTAPLAIPLLQPGMKKTVTITRVTSGPSGPGTLVADAGNATAAFCGSTTAILAP